MCVFSLPRARTQTLHQDWCESVMSPLFIGWLTWCRNFDRNWRVAPLLVPSIHAPSPRQQVGDQELIIHTCQQHRNSDLTLLNEKTTTTSEFNSRTVKSAQTLLTSLDEHFDASVHQPGDAQGWSLHINNCEAHSKFFALTPEGPLVIAACVKSRSSHT